MVFTNKKEKSSETDIYNIAPVSFEVIEIA